MLAGMVAPADASWGALMVLYTACLHYGVPETLISDSGGAFTSTAFEAVLTCLQVHHDTVESTKSESYQNLMETHFSIQRRLYDYQFSLARTPAAFEQAHQDFMAIYNTTAHQGLLNDRIDPPIPRQVLGKATGRRYSAEELNRHFAHDLFPRTTNPYGCVTLHNSHVYVEQGLPTTVMPHPKARCSRSIPKSHGYSIAHRLGGVAGVRPYPVNDYSALNGYPRRKGGFASQIRHGMLVRVGVQAILRRERGNRVRPWPPYTHAT